MKIGIITLPLNANYGGILQAYALQTILKKLGHNVEHIEIKHKRMVLPSFPKSVFIYAKRVIKKMIGRWNYPIMWERYVNEVEEPICLKNTSKFISTQLNVRLIKSFSDINRTDYEAFVVGSDQIWRPIYFKPIQNAFLAFAKDWNVKRIAYAPSFGVDVCEYTNTELLECSKLIKKFDIVTIREDSGIKLCNLFWGIDKCQKVLDPTMLLKKDDYLKLIKDTPCSNGDIMLYVLDFNCNTEKLISQILKIISGEPFIVGSKYSNLKEDIKDRIQPPVEKWLAGFRDAKFVITDSFHACVFSIIFNKPFVVLGNHKRGMSRFNSLLNEFKLQNRLVSNIDEFLLIDNISTLPEITLELLEKKRNESLNTLIEQW